MAFVLRFIKGVRNHWKKSLFATAALSYGTCYAKEKYEVSKIMRKYCTEAAAYGDQLLPLPHEPKRIIVLLNQAANKKSAKESFEKYCEPILHLGGFLVEIIQTDSEGHARRYIEDLPKLPTAILVAGGDGTLFEATTGMLRRENDSCPIGVLPVGRTNSVARNLFYDNLDPSFVEEVEGVAKATISVVRGRTEKKDAIKVELLEETDAPPKPVYAVGALHWGAFRDLRNKRDKYWYTGGLREYSAFLFGVAFGNDVTWNCTAKVHYTDPCRGCQNCRRQISNVPKQHATRWWSAFVPRTRSVEPSIDYSKIVNEKCSVVHEMEINPTELELLSRNILQSEENDVPQLKIKIGPSNVGKISFLFNAWSRVWNRTPLEADEILDVKSVEIYPVNESAEEKPTYYSIDNEDFEVKPIRISVVAEAIQMFVLEKL